MIAAVHAATAVSSSEESSKEPAEEISERPANLEDAQNIQTIVAANFVSAARSLATTDVQVAVVRHGNGGSSQGNDG